MKAAVVVPVFNRRTVTLRFLDGLYSGKTVPFHVIVVDSGSADGTSTAIRSRYRNVILIEASPDQWWAGATNLGVKEAERRGCEYVITCNDDNLVSVDALGKLVDAGRKNPDAIISSVVCYLESRDTIYFAGRKRAKLTDRFFYFGNGLKYSELGGGLFEVDLLHGMCTLFPVTVFKKVGYFDEHAFPHLFADDDLELRARRAGYRLVVDTGSVIFNDHTETGLNPYDKRIGPKGLIKLLTSRKSVFQLSARTRFLWRHRRSFFSFILTLAADYFRLFCVIILRWCLPEKILRKLARKWMQLGTT